MEPEDSLRVKKNEVSIKMEGRVKRVIDRGYGFIEDLDGSSYFFHKSALKGVGFGDLKKGDLVSFDPGENEKGKNASNVQRLKEEKTGEEKTGEKEEYIDNKAF